MLIFQVYDVVFAGKRRLGRWLFPPSYQAVIFDMNGVFLRAVDKQREESIFGCSGL